MTSVYLTKFHGLGNDFLVARAPLPMGTAEFARRVCDRRFGVGADGLLIGHDSERHDARMELRNADGSVAEMSGNGIRCFAHWLALEHQRFGALSILTDAGQRHVEITRTDDPLICQASVAMGEALAIPPPAAWDAIGAHPDRPVAHLSLGNPHTVVGVDDIEAVDLVGLGEQLAETNLEIVEPGPDPTSIRIRIHERGVGITNACGTGACASAVAAMRWGLVPASSRSVEVVMPGGAVVVDIDDGQLTLTGPSVRVAEIEYHLE
jgi:diaminopimelate epimerase